MAQPEIALSLTTYQKPSHLRRVLASIAAQRDVPGGFELVVTDDGSTDETPDIVEQFRNRVPFPVSFTTHPHKGFHPARSRNEGAAASSAPYLLFLDGDCVLPPDHVAMHLARRAPGFAMVGDCYRLNPEESERLTEERIRRGELTVLYADEERRRLAKQDFKFRLYNFLRHPTKPSKLKSGNVGIWREDYLRVNGFDENYCGWGCEDDDLGRRLRRSGVGLASILRWTRSLHLWHPQTETPSEWRQGRNVKYHLRKGWLTRCRNGLVKRKFEDMALRVVGQAEQPQFAARLLGRNLDEARATERPEVEVLFLPGQGRFSGRADMNLLVVLEDSSAAAHAARSAHLVVGPQVYQGIDPERQFRLDQFDRALEAVA